MIPNPSIEIYTSPVDRFSVPEWFAEVVIIVQHLATNGLLDAFAHQVRLVRGRFGTYEAIDFLALLLGYAISSGANIAGVDNLYEIDTTWKVLDRAAELTEQKYGRDHRSDVALRVVADHVDSAVMLVADGVLPSNEGAGYVLRRILRRSIRNLRLLAGGQRGSTEERFLHELSGTAIEALGPQYPNLIGDAANIQTVIDAEEAAFLGTLRTGSAIFDAAVEEIKRRGSAAWPRWSGCVGIGQIGSARFQLCGSLVLVGGSTSTRRRDHALGMGRLVLTMRTPTSDG